MPPTRTCFSCGGIPTEGEIFYLEDELYCERCYGNESTECDRCHREFRGTSLEAPYTRTRSDWYCPDCFNVVRTEEGYTLRARPDVASETLKSETNGQIITSKRCFGVELECTYSRTDSKRELSGHLSKGWGFSDDGSIRLTKMAIGSLELISPILKGEKGEKEIRTLGNHSYESGLSVNDSCGFHLHLDALDFKRNKKLDKKLATAPIYLYEIHAKMGGLLATWNEEKWAREKNGIENNPEYKIKKIQVGQDTLLINKGDEFYKLQNLWAVYVAFDDVLRGMLPPKRRDNHFCKSTSGLYSLNDILALEDYSDLEILYYQVDKRLKKENQIPIADQRKTGKDGSRYCGFNLEPLLRHNSQTIEIRYHSPTLNAEKILRWTDLHQTIFDYVALNDVDTNLLKDIISTETHIIKKAKKMCQIFHIKKETEEWIIARLHKFNKINATNEESIDEEVEVSEIGVPHNRGGNQVQARSSSGFASSRGSAARLAESISAGFDEANLRRIYTEISRNGGEINNNNSN